MNPTGSPEVWRKKLIHVAYRLKIADNPGHYLVTSDELLVTSDYAILASKSIRWWL